MKSSGVASEWTASYLCLDGIVGRLLILVLIILHTTEDTVSA